MVDITLPEIAASVGIVVGLCGIVAYAVRQGRVLQRVDTAEDSVKSKVSTERYLAENQALHSQLGEIKTAIDKRNTSAERRDAHLDAELRRIEEHCREHAQQGRELKADLGRQGDRLCGIEKDVEKIDERLSGLNSRASTDRSGS